MMYVAQNVCVLPNSLIYAELDWGIEEERKGGSEKAMYVAPRSRGHYGVLCSKSETCGCCSKNTSQVIKSVIASSPSSKNSVT